MNKLLRTSDIANAVGVHPNTVRAYEEWGLLPPVERTASNYRLFTEAHLEQIRMVRSALNFTWLGGETRQQVYAMVKRAAAGDLGGALEEAYQVLALMRAEQVQADIAAALLERWAAQLGGPAWLGQQADATALPLTIGKVAELLDVTTDTLRNWERNGLIEVPRNPANRYRSYGAAEIGRLRVIRTLRRARYSTMAILRMLHQLDGGQTADLRQALDTPGPHEDVYYATDRWLSTLVRLEAHAQDIIAQLEARLQKQMRPLAERRARERLGRKLVARHYAEALAEVLVHWDVPPGGVRLYGGVATLLEGLSVPAREVTLLVQDHAQVDAFAAALAEVFPAPGPPAYNEEATAYTATVLVRGIAVTAGAAEDGEANPLLGGALPWEHGRVLTLEGGRSVQVLAPELRLARALAQEQSPRHYRPLLRHLQRHGYDEALLAEALAVCGVPQEQRAYLLAELRLS